MSHLWLRGEPGPWRDAGFHADPKGMITVGATTIITDGDDDGSTGWSFDPMTVVGDIDGFDVRTAPPRTSLVTTPHPHPNGIISIDHVVVTTDDCSRTTTTLEHAGFPTRRTVTTERFGTPLLQRFFWAGDVVIELIGPPDPPPVPDPASRASLFGITFVTSDMDLTVDVLGPMIGAPGPAIQPNRSIATMRTRELGIRTRVAVMTRHITTGR